LVRVRFILVYFNLIWGWGCYFGLGFSSDLFGVWAGLGLRVRVRVGFVFLFELELLLFILFRAIVLFRAQVLLWLGLVLELNMKNLFGSIN